MTSVSADYRQPMLCVDAGKGASLPSSDWVMEPKLDGWRLICEVDEPFGIRIWGGRNGRDHTSDVGLEEIKKWLTTILPTGTIVDGEIVPMTQDSAISSILAGTDRGRLGYVIFDVLKASGADVRGFTWTVRREMLERLVPENVSVMTNAAVRLMPYVAPNEETFKRWMALGMEGAVCKRKGAVYRSGRRNTDWRKFKPQQTAEGVITGWKLGQGVGNRHRCGALLFRMLDNGAESSTAYSATPEEADSLIGHVFEMLHHGIFPSGKPRHPIFWRMRPDRDVETSKGEQG